MINPADVRHRAMDLLARREHSQRELQQKLLRRFPDPQLVDAELQKLAEEGLQSDARYAESFVRQRSGRGYGPLRIRQEARHKGLDDTDVSRALTALDADWYALAEGVLHKKFGETPAADMRERARRSRFLQYRGFAPDHFRHLVD